MTTHGTVIGEDALRFERLLPGPIERVWSYLTDGEMRAKWLAGGSTELREGGKVRLEFDHRNLSPDDDPAPERFAEHAGLVVHTGEVIRCDPPNLLEHTWVEAEGKPPSVVTFELSTKGDEVRLVLTHKRIASRTELVQTSGGWHAHLDILAVVVAGGAPGPFWASYEAREAEYEKRIPA